MAHELVSCCSTAAPNSLVLPARSHNEPFYNPQPEYWGPIISLAAQEATGHGTANLPNSLTGAPAPLTSCSATNPGADH